MSNHSITRANRMIADSKAFEGPVPLNLDSLQSVSVDNGILRQSINARSNCD